MFETILDEEERGQVGIGTLIVFIAMVLVAAIAAGVLINTAGFLQTQAEATGEESTAQVSDRIQVVSTSGNVTPNTNGFVVDNVTFVVAKAPGAGNIDLDETTIQVIGEQGQNSTQIGDLNEPIEDIIGVSNNVLTDNSDRAAIQVSLTSTDLDDASITEGGDFDNYGELRSGEEITVTFTTPSSATTTKEIRVPTTLTSDQTSVRL
ncbi:flagellin [Halorubrum sp. CGM5_25_10-8B]|uniref:archaellin/type IV pilin N-terminal domain-containing protein n=1 Tax=Halorubrum sp. CGM5_25_10-8B TaxID=2518115 RepID=UPI0010F7DCF6|nr:archaellin/type IV pilin N-terminal domain-containing protein [Halorubrum sp. CGM5_25_10-8B]TKX38056.1 flagellin [Halorubrum sp. CGM5_25_10-8B]